MRTHAALPNFENIQRMRQIPFRLIEKTEPQATAQNHADHTVKEEVFHVVCRHSSPSVARTQAPQQKKKRKAHQVHQTIPMHGNRPHVQSHGIKLRMNKHSDSVSDKEWAKSSGKNTPL